MILRRFHCRVRTGGNDINRQLKPSVQDTAFLCNIVFIFFMSLSDLYDNTIESYLSVGTAIS